MMERDPRDWSWCEAVLPKVSRTFALCIRFLPENVRRPVLLSYLLCRAADTVEDAPELPASDKERLLKLLASSLDGHATDLAPLAEALAFRDDADALLTVNAGVLIDMLASQPPGVREAIVPWIREMCHGMSVFAAEDSRQPGDGTVLRGLKSEKDLDRYCYVVAGTVGHLLTAVFTVQRPRITPATANRLDALAEDFGAGLQLVNILADVARDRARGVCYVPETICRAEGLSAGDLFRMESKDQARRALGFLFRRARQRLRSAREYCLSIPRSEYHLRLFCLIPYYLALRTLRALEQDDHYPAPDQRIKIGRSAVYRTVAAARLCAASNRMLRAYAWRLEPANRTSQRRLAW
jgi:farnesyl-diphosphate farnesyltransferase